MKHKKIKLSVILLCMGIMAQAQQANVVSGGDASGSDGTVAYSVGQIVYTSNANSYGVVSQGIQHAYEVYTLETQDVQLNTELAVFPNPTSDNLTLSISNYNNEVLFYQLFDIQGKLLISEQIREQQTQIITNSLPAATYFIVVNQDNKKVKSFKIIKK